MNLPAHDPRDLPRRHLCLGAMATGLLALAGCQTPPAPAPQPPARFTSAQVKVLRDLGFVEVPDGWALTLGGKVLFGFGEDRLGPTEVETVGRLADTLRQAGLSRLRIEGHTDNVGDATLNQRLSLRRADVVAREFDQRGIPLAQIQTRGLGMAQPITENTTEQGRAQNRRVAIIVLGD